MKQSLAKIIGTEPSSITLARSSPPFPQFNVGWGKLSSSECNNIETGERGLFHLLLAAIV